MIQLRRKHVSDSGYVMIDGATLQNKLSEKTMGDLKKSK